MSHTPYPILKNNTKIKRRWKHGYHDTNLELLKLPLVELQLCKEKYNKILILVIAKEKKKDGWRSTKRGGA